MHFQVYLFGFPFPAAQMMSIQMTKDLMIMRWYHRYIILQQQLTLEGSVQRTVAVFR